LTHLISKEAKAPESEGSQGLLRRLDGGDQSQSHGLNDRFILVRTLNRVQASAIPPPARATRCWSTSTMLRSPSSCFSILSVALLERPGGLADFLHVAVMEVDQFAEGLKLADAGHRRRLATVDLSLGVHGPALGVLMANEVFADGATFATDLDAPGAGFLFADRGHFRGANPV
jgi:hypothetical protein